MKYFKKYENFGDYQPMPFDSPKITDYSQQTPNGLAGSYDPNNDTYLKDVPLNNDNDFNRFSRDMSPNNKVKDKRFNKKVKHLKTKAIS